MSKYAPLAEHLRTLQANAWQASFVEVEALLEADLPSSARKYAEWWSNGSGHTQARAWVDAGFQTCELDISRQTVLFRRTGIRDSEAAGRKPLNSGAPTRKAAERPASRQPSPSVPQGHNSLTLCGHSFVWTAKITPDTGADGQPIECMPQANYAKANEKPLNKHGQGPFLPVLHTGPASSARSLRCDRRSTPGLRRHRHKESPTEMGTLRLR